MAEGTPLQSVPRGDGGEREREREGEGLFYCNYITDSRGSRIDI